MALCSRRKVVRIVSGMLKSIGEMHEALKETWIQAFQEQTT